MLNKNWHILPHFLFIQDAQSQRISRSRDPISTWRRFVPWQSSGSGMVLSLMGWAGLAAEEGHPWHGLGAGFWGNHSRWTQGWNPSWLFAVPEPQLLQSSGSKVFKLEWILFSSPCRKVFNNKSSYQSSGYEKRGSIKSMGRNTSFCLY